ncbi:hypothetical protein LCGC14_0366980 [marine sediment metagenome]|uniref:Uncharacterized protein n=1 Tax=marine sediment metagenome TaxID=412755 RepID=A0A0F9TP38_9ZZZZ
MAYLKQHRKAILEIEGRMLSGNFKISLTNDRDREALVEFITEIRKQLRDFDPSKAPRRGPKKEKKLVLRKKKAKRKA